LGFWDLEFYAARIGRPPSVASAPRCDILRRREPPVEKNRDASAPRPPCRQRPQFYHLLNHPIRLALAKNHPPAALVPAPPSVFSNPPKSRTSRRNQTVRERITNRNKAAIPHNRKTPPMRTIVFFLAKADVLGNGMRSQKNRDP